MFVVIVMAGLLKNVYVCQSANANSACCPAMECEDAFVSKLHTICTELLRVGRAFPKEHFPFLHDRATKPANRNIHVRFPGSSCYEQLQQGTFMGVPLDVVSDSDSEDDVFDGSGHSSDPS